MAVAGAGRRQRPGASGGQSLHDYCRENGVSWPIDQMHDHNPFGPGNPPPSSSTEDIHWQERAACQSDVPLEHSLETYTTNQCLQFLREQPQIDNPFFVWLTYDRPHWPTTLPREWFEQLDLDAVQLYEMPSAAELATWPPSLWNSMARGTTRLTLSETAFRLIVGTYYKLIEWLDAEVGRVLSELRALGLDENTVIVFTADHGDEAGHSGLYNKERRCSSGNISLVPLLIRPAPGDGLKGQMVPEPVELVDLFPTLCALAGVVAPPAIEGVDLSGCLFSGDQLDASRAVICEDYLKRALTQDNWKLVFDQNSDSECQLHDLACDPQGRRNLYGQSNQQDKRLELKRELLGMKAAT